MDRNSTVSGTTYLVEWCSSRSLFKPNDHTVTISGKTVFAGTDYSDIQFEREIGGKKFSAACIPQIDITDMKTDRAVQVSALPAPYVEACKVQSNDRGEALLHDRTEQCVQATREHLAPMVGRVFPFKRAQKCTVTTGKDEIFRGTFYYR